jgi:acyl-coenzyme A synthetase/AMP-(fatty) acid ligase
LRDHVGVHIGAIAKPDEIRFAEALPKTRSGKIMRRLLKEIASGKTCDRRHDNSRGFLVSGELSEEE